MSLAARPKIIFAPLDGRSDLSGTDIGCSTLLRMMRASELTDCKHEYFPRSFGELLDFHIYHSVRRCVGKGEPFVVVGGDHSCSYSSILATSSLLGKMTIIQVDAHHDRHKVPFLTNYTLFHHLAEVPGLSVHHFGNRDEKQQPSTKRELEAIDLTLPLYISFDVDCYSPNRVPSVNFPIPKDNDQDVEIFFEWIDSARPTICGVDLVEWSRPSSHSDVEDSFVFELFKRICSLAVQ
ncbi:MAG: arginase family protein [Aestuariivirga sp.]|uniref:arginase family protein n=1 Tax=Aestuariivirga sp. TaxID=2650926 RepID=UPI00301755E9